jgi:cytochrome-b5 reductase
LNPSEFLPFELESVKTITHNTKIFRFKFQDPNQESGLVITSCVFFKAVIPWKSDEYTIRPYTPVSELKEKGHLDFVIKRYENGNMSKYIHDVLKIGDTILIKGPIMKLKYEPNTIQHIGFIAGGTGITPCYQLLRYILANEDDRTMVSLLYANISEEDILLFKELNDLAKKHRQKLRIYYTLSDIQRVGQDWKFGIGKFTKEQIKEKMFDANLTAQSPCLVCVCGPPRFMQSISGDTIIVEGKKEQGPLKGLLAEMGFTSNNVYKF